MHFPLFLGECYSVLQGKEFAELASHFGRLSGLTTFDSIFARVPLRFGEATRSVEQPPIISASGS